MTEKRFSFGEKINFITIHKTKVPGVFELRTCWSTVQSYATVIYIQVWQFKQFYNGLKSPCCDVVMYFHKKSKCHRVILLQTKPVSSIHDVSCIGIPYTCNLVKKMVSFSFLVKYNLKKMFCFLMALVFSMHCVKLILIIVVILFIYFYINFEILLVIL